MIRKIVLALLATFGFLFSGLLVQDRLTNPKYLLTIHVEVSTSDSLTRAPEFVLVTPDGSLDDAMEPFSESGGAYRFSSSRIARTIGIRTFSRSDRAALESILIQVGTTEMLLPPGSSDAWEIKLEQGERELWILKSPPRASESILKVLGSKFVLMNWPGDAAVLTSFFSDRPFLLPVHAVLWLLAMFLILFEARVRLWVTPLLARTALRSPWLLFGVLITVALGLRLYSFGSVPGYDEGTFLAIGDQVARGAKLYSDVWDTKSPGLFVYYAALLSVGPSLAVVHLADILLLSTTALILALVALRLLASDSPALNWIPLATGLGYLLVSSVNEANFAATPEQLVQLASSSALLLLLRNTDLSLFLAGVGLGATVMFKYPAGLDFVAFGLFWLFWSLGSKAGWASILRGGLLAALGGALTLGTYAVYFLLTGTWNAFWNDNVLYDLFTYAGRNDFASVVANLAQFLRLYWAFAFLAILGLIVLIRRGGQGLWLPLVGFWGFSSLAAILMPAHGYLNYWFQLWGVVALLVPWAFYGLAPFPARDSWFVPLAVGVVVLFSVAKIQSDKPDWTVGVAMAISQQAQPQDTLFLLNANVQGAYALTGKRPPSRWVHGYGRPEAETARIMESRPTFLVTAQDYEFTQRWSAAMDDYRLVARVGPHHIYKHKTHD